MAFDDDVNLEIEEEEPTETPPEESNNRTFLIVAGILGGIMLLTLVCTAAYAFWFLPRSRNQETQKIAQINANNTATAVALTQAAVEAKWTPTSKPTLVPSITPTKKATSTPVVFQATATEIQMNDATATQNALSTQNALATQLAIAQKTVINTSTALPAGGFADEVGAPGLLALAVVLVIVIFLVRRLRTAS